MKRKRTRLCAQTATAEGEVYGDYVELTGWDPESTSRGSCGMMAWSGHDCCLKTTFGQIPGSSSLALIDAAALERGYLDV